MPRRALRIHPDDDVLVALADLDAGEILETGATHASPLTLVTPVLAKHKVVLHDLAVGDPVVMYGVLVGRATHPIPRGAALTTENVRHDASRIDLAAPVGRPWRVPDFSRFAGRSFEGFHRTDGRVGTRNLWLVLPLVFCENRNVRALQEAFDRELGYGTPESHRLAVREMARRYQHGEPVDTPLPADGGAIAGAGQRVFPNLDGIRFLTHEGGCGGTRQDTRALCGLLAGYLVHPNVAGATVLSLGCQHAQVDILREEVARRDPMFAKPMLTFEQQQMGTEEALMRAAIKETFAGLMEANRAERAPAPLSALSVGLKCGGSDGFSGISANPGIGHAADLISALGGTTLLAEFPELLGSEQDLIERCVRPELARRFAELMGAYDAQRSRGRLRLRDESFAREHS